MLTGMFIKAIPVVGDDEINTTFCRAVAYGISEQLIHSDHSAILEQHVRNSAWIAKAPKTL